MRGRGEGVARRGLLLNAPTLTPPAPNAVHDRGPYACIISFPQAAPLLCMAFSALSPQLRREQLRVVEAWPVTSVVWTSAGKLNATARHHAERVDVDEIDLNALHGHTLRGSLALYWQCLTGRLSGLDRTALRDHAANYHWPVFAEALDEMLRWAAKASPSLQHDLQQEAAAALAPFKPDALRDISFTEFLRVLGFQAATTPVSLQVPLLHWLGRWSARQQGSTLACDALIVQQPAAPNMTVTAGPCPLSSKEWGAELKQRETDKSLVMVDVLSRFAAYASPAAGGPPAEPNWMVFLKSDAAVAQEECVKDLALFAEVPDGDAPRLASALGLLAGPIALKGKTKEYLGTVTTAAMLHVAARAIHSECPVGHRAALHKELNAMIAVLKDKHGARLGVDYAATTLATVAPIILAAERRQFTGWDAAALAIAGADGIPVTAFSILGPVKDIASFRIAIRQLAKTMVTQLEHDALRQQVKQTLSVTQTNDDWFVQGAEAPGAPLPNPAPGLQSGIEAVTGTAPLTANFTGFAPKTSAASAGVVRLSGLSPAGATSMAPLLTAELGVPLFITAEDARRGFGFATITAAKYAAMFDDANPERFFYLGQWRVTVSSKKQGGATHGTLYRSDPALDLTVRPEARPKGAAPAQRWQDRKRKQGGADRDAAQQLEEPAATTVPSKKDKSLTVKRKGAPWKTKKRG